MNINLLNTCNTKNYELAFTGRRKYPKDIPPKKLEFTDAETEFKPVLLEHKRLESNIRTQKANLWDYYSSSDKADYKELLKENNKLKNKMRHIAKKYNTNYVQLELEIDSKNTYNIYAPKIYRAKSKIELNELKEMLDKRLFGGKTKELLFKLIGIIEPFLKK